MKKIMPLIIMLIIASHSYGALTVNNVPKTKTGGTTPTLQDSLITSATTNVGIGSTAPGTTLDVQGSIRSSSAITANNVGIGTSLTSDAVLSVVNGNVGIGTWIADTALLTVGSLKNTSGTFDTKINLGRDFSSTQAQNLKLKIYDAVSGSDYGFGISSGRLEYVVNATSDDHAFYGASNLVALIKGNGNVGIGTASISAKLVVENTGAFNSFVVNDQAVDTSPFVIDQGGNVGIGTTVPLNSFDVASRFNVGSNGNVGVGTVNPISEFQVNGTATASQLNLTGTSNITFTPNNESISNTIDGFIDISGGITATGNVGIGTTVATGILDVRGTTAWTVKTASNQACNTTCSPSACVSGQDNIALVSISCTDATADYCSCMGP